MEGPRSWTRRMRLYTMVYMDTKINLSKILGKFGKKWVALSPDYKSVVASGDTLQDTIKKVGTKERDRLIFHKVIPGSYAPSA